MIDTTQLLRGVLEACCLKLIKNEESYGYSLLTQLQEKGFTELGEGTLYPILLRLEKKKLVGSRLKASSLGPKRKYYYLLEDGEVYLKQFMEYWESLEEIVGGLFKEELPYDSPKK